MGNPSRASCVRAMGANAIPQETKRRGARVNFVFVFLAVILLVFSMIFVLPSAFLTDNNSGMTQFFGYVALFAFLWLVLAIVVKSNQGS